MESTEFKVFIVIAVIFLIALAFELPARLVKHFFQNPNESQMDHLGNQQKINDKDEPDKGGPERAWVEQDFWYPPEVKPVRDGVYRVRWFSSSGIPVLNFAYWRDQSWGVISHSVQGAEKNRHGGNCVVQGFQWRGVTYDK